MTTLLDFDIPPEPVERGEPVEKDGSVHFWHLIDTDYFDYAMYTIENRAIPSVIDGFKPVQRKLFYQMRTLFKNKKVKCAELGSSLPSIGYAHGETSAQEACVKMARTWFCNIPAFLPHGNFGSRMIQESASPRYIYVSGNPIVESIFTDNDVLPEGKDPLESPEPLHYLPLIPWVLVNGQDGMSVGFRVFMLPRDPKMIAIAVKEYLSSGKIKQKLTPSMPKFKGSVEEIESGKYRSTGCIEKGPRNSYIISELPWCIDRSKYFDFLNSLVESKMIDSFEDHCGAHGFKFIIRMNPEQRSVAESDLVDYFRLSEIHTENYTTLDEHGKLKVFDSVNDIIAYFCDYRTKMVQKQIDFDISKMNENLSYLKEKLSFINLVRKLGTTAIFKLTKSELSDMIVQKITSNMDSVNSLLRIPVYSFTADIVAELEKQIDGLQKEIDIARGTKPTDKFLTRLKELKL